MGKSKSSGSGTHLSSGAWQPRLLFTIFILVVFILSAVEIRNLIRRPSLFRLEEPKNRASMVIYQRGRANAREAWLLTEPLGDAGSPSAVLRIDCSPTDTRTGDIIWSKDGRILSGMHRRMHGNPASDTVLWTYDFASQKLWTIDKSIAGGKIAHHLATASALADFMGRHGGRGPLATTWYDLGKQGHHLFAWQITRWESALP